MTDILFGQSYYLRFDPKLYAAMQPYPPLGTLYAASYLRERGYSVALFDAMLVESEAEWERALDEHQPRYAVLFEDNFNYLSKMCLLRMRQAAFTMMRAAKGRGCIVIVSGSDATDHLQEFFEHGADYILVGEGEVTLGELLDTLKENHQSKIINQESEIKGLAFKNVDGLLTRTPPREFIRDLDTLPFPAWDLVNAEQYRKLWLERHHHFSMNLVTTRGCPYHCNWCAKPIYGQRYNVRSPENVVAEIKMLRDKYTPDHLEFADDIFGLKPGWIARFADLLNADGIRIPFKCLLRADLAADETVEALARAGCQLVWMGAESGSQKVLDAMDKGTRVEQIHAATERLHRAGIQVGFFLQFGYLGEDHADIEKTLQMVRDCAPDDIGISVSYPLPGTKFFERVKSDLGEKQNWNDSDDLAMMYRGTYSPEFYRVLHRVVHYEFRMRRAIRSLGRNPTRGLGQTVRALLYIPANFVRWQWTRYWLNKFEPQRRQERRGKTGNAFIMNSVFSVSSVAEVFLETERAFDAVAPEYDSALGNNTLIQRMREHVIQKIVATFPRGVRLLDMGCGTGIDAVDLASRGYEIVAVDSSRGMVERTLKRISQAQVDNHARAIQLGIHELERLYEEPFDGLYSNLGPLNCVPDLRAASREMARLLKPRGRIIASVIGKYCPWEFAFYVLRFDFKRARIRLTSDPVPVPLQGETIWTRYYSPHEFYRAFADDFELVSLRALNVFMPPPYLAYAYERHKNFFAPLAYLDDHLGSMRLVRNYGDHFLIEMQKRN